MDGESVFSGVVLDAAGKDTRGEIISNHPLVSQVDSILTNEYTNEVRDYE